MNKPHLTFVILKAVREDQCVEEYKLIGNGKIDLLGTDGKKYTIRVEEEETEEKTPEEEESDSLDYQNQQRIADIARVYSKSVNSDNWPDPDARPQY